MDSNLGHKNLKFKIYQKLTIFMVVFNHGYLIKLSINYENQIKF